MFLRASLRVGVFSILSVLGVLKTSAGPTLIDDADGKRLLAVTEKDITDTNTGKIVLYVQDKNILVDIHAPATLVVDDHDVRHSPAGVKLATFDGEGIRHADRGKVIINYHHPDICPDAQSNRIYRVNGDPLTKQQLVAVLYYLKPDLFKLSDQETAEQQKAMAEAGAEEERLAKADHVAGNWMVLNGSGPIEKVGGGTIVFGAKKGEAYPVTYDHSKSEGPTFQGVAYYKEVGGDKLLWTAYGSPKSVAMCVYEINGGTLTGKWYPWYIDGDAKNVGTENLKGPETLDGDYTIESAKAATTGAAYTGTVSIKPAKIVGADDNEAPYNITWTLGTAKVYGIGIRHKNLLIVAMGTGAVANVAAYGMNNDIIQGDWYKLGSTEKGMAAATKQ